MSDDRVRVFVDESGDAGFKLEQGSSPMFCLAAVICRTAEHRKTTEQVVQDLKTQMGLKQTYEFHFVRESLKRRRQFCEAVAGCPFIARVVVVDKFSVFRDAMLRKSPKVFYAYVAGRLFQHALGSIKDCHIYVDGKMDREIRTALRQELNKYEKVAHKISPAKSAYDPMVQLADMIAGSVHQSYRGEKASCTELREILTPRLESVLEIPETTKGQLPKES